MKNKLLVILLLCPLAAAADWSYDGQATGTSTTASGSSTGEPAMTGGTESSMAMTVAGPAPAGAPSNGITMAKVRETVGEPDGILDSVGDPPITRWQYPNYVVYFEYDRVITSVAGHW